LWYVLAAANALSGDADLIAGTQLKVPEMAASKNDATSFRPYNPGEIVGSTSPGLPYIPPAAGCASFAIILTAAILAIAAPYLIPVIQSVGAVVGAVIVGASTFAANAIATAAGSALGQNTFSWKASLKEGVIAGLTFGLGKLDILAKLGSIGKVIQSTSFTRIAAQAVLNKAIDITASKVVGLPSSFSWKAIAIESVTNTLAEPIVTKLSDTFVSKITDIGTQKFTGNLIGGIVTQAIKVGVSEAMGVKAQFNFGQIAGNAFAASLSPNFQSMKTASDLKGEAANDAGVPDTGSTSSNQPSKTAADYVNFGNSQLSSQTNVIPTEKLTVAVAQSKAKTSFTVSSTSDSSSDAKQQWMNDYIDWANKNHHKLPTQQTYEDLKHDYDDRTNVVKVLDRVEVTGIRHGSNTKGYGPLRSGLIVSNTVNSPHDSSNILYTIYRYGDGTNRSANGRYTASPLNFKARNSPSNIEVNKLELSVFDSTKSSEISLVNGLVKLGSSYGITSSFNIGKDSIDLNLLSMQETNQISYGNRDFKMFGLSNSLSVRSIQTASIDSNFIIDSNGVESSAGFKAEAIALQAKYSLSKSIDLPDVNIKIGVDFDFNAGGIGGTVAYNGELSREKLRASIDLGATPGLGARVSPNVDLSIKTSWTQFINYLNMYNPDITVHPRSYPSYEKP